MATKLHRVGAYVTDVPADLIFLWGLITTSGNVTHLRAQFATAGYQVSAGKTLHLVKLRFYPHGSGDPFNHTKIGYADNDVGLNTITARTAPVMAIGLDDTAKNGLGIAGGSTWAGGTGAAGHVFGDEHSSFWWPIAVATKFPFMRMAAVGNPPDMSIQAWCIEL